MNIIVRLYTMPVFSWSYQLGNNNNQVSTNLVSSLNNPLFLPGQSSFNGFDYDLKTITGCGNSTLRDAVKRKRGQSTRFIFDLSNSALTNADVERQMYGMFGNPQTNFVKEVVIIRNDSIEKVFRKK